MWILGSVSDQYQYVVRGKVCNRRKILLALGLACFLLSGGGLVFLSNYGAVLDAFQGSGTFLRQVLGRAAGGTLAGLAAAALAVFQYISLYDVFQSCNPGTSVVFLVLSVIFPILVPFFLFADRKKELGMPRRRDAAASAPEQRAEEEAHTDPRHYVDRDHPVDF